MTMTKTIFIFNALLLMTCFFFFKKKVQRHGHYDPSGTAWAKSVPPRSSAMRTKADSAASIASLYPRQYVVGANLFFNHRTLCTTSAECPSSFRYRVKAAMYISVFHSGKAFMLSYADLRCGRESKFRNSSGNRMVL